MNLKNFLGIAGVLGVIGGLPFILFPELSLSLYGKTTDASGLLMARYFGAAFLSFGVLIWFVREAIDPDEHRHVLIPLGICALIGIVITVIGQSSGLVNAFGWSTTLLFTAFAVGFWWFSRRTT